MNSKFQPSEDMFDDVEGHVRHIEADDTEDVEGHVRHLDGPAQHDGADHGTVR
jgi:hypothetical protein